MPDGCYLVLICQRADKAHVEQVLDEANMEFPIDGVPTAIRLEYEEVNGAGGDQRTELAEKGLTFVGYHEDGDEYGAYEFAAHAGGQEEIQLWQGSPVLVLTDALEATQDALSNLDSFRTCRAAACATLGIDPATFKAPAAASAPEAA